AGGAGVGSAGAVAAGAAGWPVESAAVGGAAFAADAGGGVCCGGGVAMAGEAGGASAAAADCARCCFKYIPRLTAASATTASIAARAMNADLRCDDEGAAAAATAGCTAVDRVSDGE